MDKNKYELECGCILKTRDDGPLIIGEEGKVQEFIWCKEHGEKIKNMLSKEGKEATEKFVHDLLFVDLLDYPKRFEGK